MLSHCFPKTFKLCLARLTVMFWSRAPKQGSYFQVPQDGAKCLLPHTQGCALLLPTSTNNNNMFKLKSIYPMLNSHTGDTHLVVLSHPLRRWAPKFYYFFISRKVKISRCQKTVSSLEKKKKNILAIEPISVFKSYFGKYCHHKQNWPFKTIFKGKSLTLVYKNTIKM